MSSLAKPTILDAINGAWLHANCSTCNQPVAFQWHPLPGEPDAAWVDASLFGRLCRDCVLAAAEAVKGPPEEALQRATMRRSLRARYRRIERMWKLLGIRSYEETEPAFYTRREFAHRRREVRQLLGLVGDRQPTLAMERWYRLGQHRGQNDPYLELFTISGVLPVATRTDVHYGDFAEPPRYLLGERTHKGRREVLARVLLAIHAGYPPASPTEIHWRWNPLLPDMDHDPDIYRFGHCSHEDFGRLASYAQRLYFEVDARGRKRNTGRYPRGEEDRFEEDVERVLTAREQDGVVLTKVPMLADALGMSESSLHALFKRVPEAHERYLEHKRTLQGR